MPRIAPPMPSAYAALAYGPTGRELAAATSNVVQTGLSAMTDVTNLSITFTVGSRPVWVDAFLPFVFVTGTATTVGVFMRDEVPTVIRQTWVNMPANSGQAMAVRERIATPGTYTRKLSIQRLSGSGTLSVGFTGETLFSHSIRAVEA